LIDAIKYEKTDAVELTEM